LTDIDSLMEDLTVQNTPLSGFD